MHTSSMITPASARSATRRAIAQGFTLVELLVVIGIIATLIAILLPTLGAARRRANQTACGSNLHQIYLSLQMYSTESKGWLFPVGANNVQGYPTTYGTNYPPHERWPSLTSLRTEASRAKVITYTDPASGATAPYTLDIAAWRALPEAAQLAFDAKAFSSPVLLCPEDHEAIEAHSYVLNQHLADERIRFGSTRLGTARSPVNVIIAGEKKNFFNGQPVRDYYMEYDQLTGAQDFDRVVEEYRHGIKNGSNYLFMDGHVENRMRNTVGDQLDPWYINTGTATPPTGTNPPANGG